MNILRALIPLLLFVVVATNLGAESPHSKALSPPFQEGDRVAFIGDSITHGGQYHSDIYLFYATRFPDQPFRCFNCGISGDTSVGTNVRFDTDIAAHQPNVATIMLGMNDAWAWCFQDGEPTEKMLSGRRNAMNTYTREMNALAARLTKQGCRLVLIKPSIYDQTAKLATSNLMGKNDLLGEFGNVIDILADRYDGTIVDFYSHMNELNERLQRDDPSATIVGRDRVHPGKSGHFYMAYVFLKTQGMPHQVSMMQWDATQGKLLQQNNCVVEPGAQIKNDQIDFTCTEQALPFPVVGDQLKTLDWAPFQEELNQQILKVTGLTSGDYQLNIDEIVVGNYSSDQLANGVNLSGNTSTPQFRHALEVKRVNDARVAAIDKLRSVAHVRYTMLSKLNPKVSEEDREALKAALDAHVEGSKGKPWYGYLKTQVKKYLATLSVIKDVESEVETLTEELWKINQPRKHQWALTPVQ